MISHETLPKRWSESRGRGIAHLVLIRRIRMTVTIHSRNEMPRFTRPRSKGKATEVDSRNFKIRSTPDGLVASASVTEVTGSGEEGGLIRPITRQLTVEFTAQDLKRLLNAALDAKLLASTFSVARKKKKR